MSMKMILAMSPLIVWVGHQKKFNRKVWANGTVKKCPIRNQNFLINHRRIKFQHHSQQLLPLQMQDSKISNNRGSKNSLSNLCTSKLVSGINSKSLPQFRNLHYPKTLHLMNGVTFKTMTLRTSGVPNLLPLSKRSLLPQQWEPMGKRHKRDTKCFKMMSMSFLMMINGTLISAIQRSHSKKRRQNKRNAMKLRTMMLGELCCQQIISN